MVMQFLFITKLLEVIILNTSSITFLWQHENFVSLYCNDYFNGHNKLHIDDNEVIKDYDLESATVIINNLLAGIYKVWTSGPDGQSEDKYIEIYPEGIKEQLYYTTRFIYSYIFCSKLYSAKFINSIIILVCKNTDTSISINSLINRYIYIGKHSFNVFIYLQMI